MNCRRVYVPGRVLASTEFRGQYHVITPRKYMKYDVKTGAELQAIDYSFADNYTIPKKVPSMVDRNLENIYKLGDVTAACFGYTGIQLHLFLGTNKGRFIDYLPDMNKITRLVQVSEHVVEQISYVNNLAVCMTKAGLVLLPDEYCGVRANFDFNKCLCNNCA
ncbi:Hypothetical_protein [Hexamita inflata]|uniref:Hypothetical_protein n=1 Tax=Hexamita inflata TaxID=28002 RepID=A0AA86P0W6_9EUKA|nr:Hypothetical protein HINF_LOCUS17226 [Hexamita inflata]